MKKQNMTEISQKSGRSLSTVSKVLRNCPGVDPETRAAVRSAMEGDSATELIRRGKKGQICVILPDNPKYFWHRALSVIKEKDGGIVTKIYSSINREEKDREVSLCVREAVEAGASAVILAACPEGTLRDELARLAGEMLIVQLCEYTPIPNTFYVGSDPYRDGAALARAVTAKEGCRPCVGVIRRSEISSCERRTQGFLDTLGDRARILHIDQPELSTLYASHLARAIDCVGERLDYLFCCSGMTDRVCDALYKLKGRMSARYVGFEYPPAAQKHWDAGRIAALAEQKIEEQLETALGLARIYVNEQRFPDKKFTYLPSEYRFFSLS